MKGKAKLMGKEDRYNIAHIMPWYTIGGTEWATMRIAQGTKEDFKSTIFHLPHAEVVGQMFANEGFETALFQNVEPSYRHPGAFLRASFSLARDFKRKKIDLIHCADLSAAYFAGLAGIIAGVPVLCHIRNRFPDLSRRDQSFLYAVNHFVFVSRDTWKHFGFNVPERRGTVLYDGIKNVPEIDNKAGQCVKQKYDIPADAKVIGMVARVGPQKDYATLMRAAVRVVAVDKNVRFLIIGDHSGSESLRQHYEDVKRMLAESGIAEHFIFTDFQSDVNPFFDAMDIFVLSTNFEGLPLVILEAMAHGKPVIATAVDGIPEIVTPEKTGLLHSHRDDLQLSEQILSLLQNPERAVQLGEAGRQEVKTNWTNERFIRDIKSLYRQMIEKTFIHSKVTG